jgi:hypothetical protein
MGIPSARAFSMPLATGSATPSSQGNHMTVTLLVVLAIVVATAALAALL